MFLVLAASAALSFLTTADHAAAAPAASTTYTGIGFDYFTPTTQPLTQHSTAEGPVTATNGFTQVVAFGVGKYTTDALNAIGVSTSYFGGHFTQSLLPGITRATNPANPYDRVAYETIAYNQRFHEFIIASLPISNSPDPEGDGDTTLPPIVSRSLDGLTWSNPTPVSSAAGLRPEKEWISCDNSIFSQYYGRCYILWDDNDNNDSFHAAYSNDGGNTWTAGQTAGQSEFGAIGLVQPNGSIVAVSEDSSGYDGTERNIISTVSTNGGANWSPALEISPISTHTVAGNIRTQSLPTAAVDSFGNLDAIWQDCRFERNCVSNDLVLSTSRDGTHWSSPMRLPLEGVGSNMDLFTPSLAVRSSVLGTTLGLEFYVAFPLGCAPTTCSVVPVFMASGNGGQSFSSPELLTPPMYPAWLASTGSGYMLGDYLQAVYPKAFLGAITVGFNPAYAPSGDPLIEGIVIPYREGQGGLLRRAHVKATIDRGGGIGEDDSAALHVGARTPTYQAKRFAPKVKFLRHVTHPI
jgi:hypothetical protein